MYCYKLLLITICSIVCTLHSKGQNVNDSISIDTSTKSKRIEIDAIFPGGDNAWSKFLYRRLNSSVPLLNDAPAGRYTVKARFIIDKDGSVSFVDAVTNLGYGMEEELIRVIKKSPKWQYATINAIPVKAYRLQPITFFVDPYNFTIHSDKPYTIFTQTANEVTVSAKKVRQENLIITISEGTITQTTGDPGKYIIQVDKPGRVLIELFNSKKKNKKIGAASFEVQSKM
jgi:hypothetical protein